MNREIYSPVISGCGAYFVHEMLATGIPSYRIQGIGPIRASIPLLQRFARSDAEIIHTQPDLGPLIIGRDQKAVVTFHGFSLDLAETDNASKAQSLFYRRVLRPSINASLAKADVITAVSKFTADLVASYLGLLKKIEVVNNGIDTDRFYPRGPVDHQDIVIFFSGNPTKRKGAEYLVALANSLPRGITVQYTEGFRRRYAMQTTDNLVAIPAVARSSMPALYRNADIFLFPSYREGMSLALLEAMASGLPIVAANTSSIPELIVHGKGGYLFEYGNHTQMLKYVMKLVQNRALREEMGSFNRERVTANYNQKKMISTYLQLFESL